MNILKTEIYHDANFVATGGIGASGATSNNKVGIMNCIVFECAPGCEIRYRRTNVQEIKVTSAILSYMDV